jgi:hypothetical protein
MSMDDPSLKPFATILVVDRARYGLSPLPRDAKVTVEDEPKCYANCGYDAMLHIYDKASHDVAFRKENGAYKWVGEQEVCRGPREYRTVNGRFKENVVISYFEHVEGQLDGLHIWYNRPEDPMGLHEISVSTAKTILKAWRCE